MTNQTKTANPVPNRRPARRALPLGTVLVGDALEQLRRLPDRSVHAVVTSPPFFGLRDYGHPGQSGLEATVDDWVENLMTVLVELRRVLSPSGSIWLNLGDSYSRHRKLGAPPKSLLLAPERLALAATAAGFVLRNKVVWQKRNPSPTSVKDRLNTAWEPIYFLTVSGGYYFDLDAVRVPHTSTRRPSANVTVEAKRPPWQGPLAGTNNGLARLKAAGLAGHPLGKNLGDVWPVATSNFRGGHHATYPEALIEPAILASTPERICVACDQPWARKMEHNLGRIAVRGELRPTCRCKSGWRRAVVLDPYMGSGTTAVVAERLGRDWVGVDVNADFARMTRRRLEQARVKRQNEAAQARRQATRKG